MKTIAIAGSIAQKPARGGHTWVFLQYLLGFRKLGWDVLFLDRLDSEMCHDEAGVRVPLERSCNQHYLRDVMRGFGLESNYVLLSQDGTSVVGGNRAQVIERVRRCAALINVMGFLDDPEILAAAPVRVFVDIDPGFGQMWHALGLADLFDGHDVFVTIAENIGKPDCAIPTCGRTWLTTKQPIVLDEWRATPCVNAEDCPITSVASWRGAYAPVAYQGTTYGLRAHEFRKFSTLPSHASTRFEVALDIHPADAKDTALLLENGWSLVEPFRAAGDPWRYRSYIQQSAAELMIAKGMYVQARSGWFSDRSACYLASGRPVLAQNTMLEGLVPTGAGLLTFSSLEEAAEGARAIVRDYHHHAGAAHDIAAEYFDSSTVLGSLVRKIGLC